MMEDAKGGKFELILAKSISQFQKDTSKLLNDVRDLRQHGVTVYFEEEGIHSFFNNWEFLVTINAAVDYSDFA